MRLINTVCRSCGAEAWGDDFCSDYCTRKFYHDKNKETKLSITFAEDVPQEVRTKFMEEWKKGVETVGGTFKLLEE